MLTNDSDKNEFIKNTFDINRLEDLKNYKNYLHI